MSRKDSDEDYDASSEKGDDNFCYGYSIGGGSRTLKYRVIIIPRKEHESESTDKYSSDGYSSNDEHETNGTRTPVSCEGQARKIGSFFLTASREDVQENDNGNKTSLHIGLDPCLGSTKNSRDSSPERGEWGEKTVGFFLKPTQCRARGNGGQSRRPIGIHREHSFYEQPGDSFPQNDRNSRGHIQGGTPRLTTPKSTRPPHRRCELSVKTGKTTIIPCTEMVPFRGIL